MMGAAPCADGPVSEQTHHTSPRTHHPWLRPVPAGDQIALPQIPKKIYCVSREFSPEEIAGTDMATGKGIIIWSMLQDLP